MTEARIVEMRVEQPGWGPRTRVPGVHMGDLIVVLSGSRVVEVGSPDGAHDHASPERYGSETWADR